MSKKHKWKSNPHHKSDSWSYLSKKQPKEAFRLGQTKRPVWGGAFSTMQHLDWSVLICCNGQSPVPVIYASPKALVLMPKLEIPSASPYIRLDWADLSTPEIGQGFWESLVQGLQRIGKPGPIGVCCMGGTGRTGTALAIIAQLSGAVPAGQCPLAFIRANYARDAVETNEQGKYITSITGIDLQTLVEKPYHSMVQSDKGFWKDKEPATTSASYCVHGKPLHLFCGECLAKSGTMSNYHREGM